MAKAEHLRLVDTDTGEINPDAPATLNEALIQIDAITDQLVGAENNVRSMRAQMANLRREVAGEVDRDHQQFPQAVAHFRYWQERCNHPQSEFTADRFKLVLPFIKRHKPEHIREAIRGAAFDAFTPTAKNGRKIRHDGWDLIFRNEDKFQNFRERAPDYIAPTFAQLKLIEVARETAARCLERARLIEKGTDDVACAHLLIEINALIARWQESPDWIDAETT